MGNRTVKNRISVYQINLQHSRAAMRNLVELLKGKKNAIAIVQEERKSGRTWRVKIL
jgi:hypothetical protein